MSGRGGRSRVRCYDAGAPIWIRAGLFVSQVMLKCPAVAENPADILSSLALFARLPSFSLWDRDVYVSVILFAQVIQTLLYCFLLFGSESMGGLCGGSRTTVSTAFA